MVGGPVGNEESACRGEVHLRRNVEDQAGLDHQFLGEATRGNGVGHDAIARLEDRNTLADFADDARTFEPGGERKRGFELILALNDQRVSKIDAGGFDTDHHLPFARLQGGNVFDHEAVRLAKLLTQYRFHNAARSPTLTDYPLETCGSGIWDCSHSSCTPSHSSSALDRDFSTTPSCFCISNSLPMSLP